MNTPARGTGWCRGVFLLLLGAGVFLPRAAAEKHALLIGIDRYPHVRPLRGAVNDVLAIQQVLLNDLHFPKQNVQVLLNDAATKEGILKALSDLAARTRPGDTLLWYYSGHGWMVSDENGDEALFDPNDRYDEALVPYDAVPWPRERAFEPNPTLLIDDDIGRALAKLLGRRLVVVFDSCYSGTATRALPGEDSGSRSLYDGLAPPLKPKFKSLNPHRESLDLGGELTFLAAASATQPASDLGEFDGQRHGALTAGLLRTIQKTGPGWQNTISWDGLLRQARRDMQEHGFGTQTPSVTAPGALARLPVDQFFQPLPAQEIATVESPGAFDVYLESNKYQFAEGDLLELVAQSERDGYLYVFDINAEQHVTQLFPNRWAPDNHVAAGKLIRIPSKSDRFQLRAGKPYGTSTVVAVVTRSPWAELGELHLPASLQPITDFQKTALRDTLRNLASAPEWSSQKMQLQIEKPGTDGTFSIKPEPPLLPEPEKPAPAPPPPPAPAASGNSEDDANVTPEEQADLPLKRPNLFRMLERLAERYSPVFWQDVAGSSESHFRPWKDFFVRYDFDSTELGPNWPSPPGFQDETKRSRNHSLDVWLTPTGGQRILPSQQNPGVFRVISQETGETVQLDLRPYIYWTVLSTPTHYFFHYAAFKAEDWKPLFGHPGDLEGCTIVVNRKTERVVAALTLAHDDVQVNRGLDDEPEGNIEVLADPGLSTRGIGEEDTGHPVNGALSMQATRSGDAAPKEHQDVYSESRGHGQYGSHKIHPSRYIVYANFLDEATWTAPSFDYAQYPLTDKFEEVRAKHKYRLLYFGTGKHDTARAASQRSLWSEYQDLGRFPGGVNPPWCWRDNLFFRTGWWRDPRTIVKVGDAHYRINPYLK